MTVNQVEQRMVSQHNYSIIDVRKLFFHVIVHEQCRHQMQMRQGDQSAVVQESSQPYMVESSEAVDTDSLTELAGLQNSTIPVPVSCDRELVVNHSSLLSLLIGSGARVKVWSSNQVIVDIHGRTIVFRFTQDNAFYKECSRKAVELSDSVARWRQYLTSWGIHSTAIMANDVPTIVVFGSVSILSSTSLNSISVWNNVKLFVYLTVIL